MFDASELTKGFYGVDEPFEAGMPQLQAFLPFEKRGEYLAWRAEWRDYYRELSERIRTMRKAWRAEGSAHTEPLHGDLWRCRRQARLLLALRWASKVKAEALYQASKSGVEIA